MTLSVLSFVSFALQYLANGIVGLLEGFYQHIFGVVGSSIETILMDYSLKVDAFGVWAVPLMVLLIGLTGMGPYLLIMMVGIVNDAEMGL